MRKALFLTQKELPFNERAILSKNLHQTEVTSKVLEILVRTSCRTGRTPIDRRLVPLAGNHALNPNRFDSGPTLNVEHLPFSSCRTPLKEPSQRIRISKNLLRDCKEPSRRDALSARLLETSLTNRLLIARCSHSCHS